MTLTPAFLDELRARTTLSTLIGKSVKVTKAGREYKACCPFHNEKTPSFTINDEKGFYHCFGCGAHGDAIRWMTDQRGLPFMDGVKELADAAGMDLPAPDPRSAKRAEQARSLHDVMAAAAHWFEDQLGSIDGAEARDYLKKRGITDETRRAFGIGYAPDSRGKLKVALRDFPEAMLAEAGILIQPDDGGRESYDRFRGRLMIPIKDARGRVIAFGGRILGQGEPKYLNSPDTPLFDKGRTLYNLDKAAPTARKSGRAVVVEGYMDVIALAQAGITEAVAPLGTALTEHQIERLWSLTDTPVLCFDGDAAGQKAATRAAHRALPLLKPGHSLAFATLPPGLDPDDLIRAQGSAAMQAVLGQSRPLAELLWQRERDSAPLDTPEQRAGLKQRLSGLVATISHDDVRGHYAQMMRERHDALFFSPRARSEQSSTPYPPARMNGVARRPGQRWSPPPPPPGREARTIQSDGLGGALLRGVLAGLIRWPAEISRHRESLAAVNIADERLAALTEALLDAADQQETVETDALLTIWAETDVYNVAKELLRADGWRFSFNQITDADRARRDLAEAIGVMVAMPRIEAELEAITRSFSQSLDEEGFARQQALRSRRESLIERIAEMAAPAD
jgi:DNA primase